VEHIFFHKVLCTPHCFQMGLTQQKYSLTLFNKLKISKYTEYEKFRLVQPNKFTQWRTQKHLSSFHYPEHTAGQFLVCPVCQASLGEYGTQQCHWVFFVCVCHGWWQPSFQPVQPTKTVLCLSRRYGHHHRQSY